MGADDTDEKEEHFIEKILKAQRLARATGNAVSFRWNKIKRTIGPDDKDLTDASINAELKEAYHEVQDMLVQGSDIEYEVYFFLCV